MSKSRVETFSDGVFAIAITLLILTISDPNNYAKLGQELANRWPSLLAYIVSFAVIGIMWLNHHTVFTHLEQVDRNFVLINLVLLMTIVFLPYPTRVLGQALAQHQGTRTAAIVYGVTMAVNAYAWTALWLYGSLHRRLLNPGFPESERATATVLFTAGGVIYTLAIGVAWLNAYAFLALQGVLALYYAFDPISRRLNRGSGQAGSARGGTQERRPSL